MVKLIEKIKSLFTQPTLKIIFTPETSEQRERAVKTPWWKEPNTDEAKRLINDEAIRRGYPPPIPPLPTNGYGSGWWIEFPRCVAMIISKDGLEKAAEYVRWTFDQGTTRDADEKVRAANPGENSCYAYYG